MNWPVAVFVLVTVGAALGDAIEDWIEASPQRDEISNWLRELEAEPLNLNLASKDEIAELPFFDREAAGRIIRLRNQSGEMVSLRAIFLNGDWTPEQRLVLRRFTAVRELIPEQGKIRSSAVGSPDESASAYNGRFRAEFQGSRGQEGYVFGEWQESGSDFVKDVSAGIRIPSRGYLSTIAIGDFQYESGTGLVFASAFGTSGWLTSSSQRLPDARGIVFKPTADGLSRFRGAAVSLERGIFRADFIESYRQLDAAVDEEGRATLSEGSSSSSELAEARSNRLTEATTGGVVQIKVPFVTAGAAYAHFDYSPSLAFENGNDVLSKDQIDAGSISLRATRGQVTALSEMAGSSSGGKAHQSALLLTQNQLRWLIYHVRADADYFVSTSKLWGGYGADAANATETGIYTVVNFAPQQVSLRASQSETPFRTAFSPLSRRSNSIECKWWIHSQTGMEGGITASRSTGEVTTEAGPSATLKSDKLRLETVLERTIEYRIRYEIKSASRTGQDGHDVGTLLSAEAKINLFNCQIATRVFMFNCESSDVMIRAGEGTVYGASPLLSFSGAGRRMSLLVSRNFGSFQLRAELGTTYSTSLDKASTDGGLEAGFHW